MEASKPAARQEDGKPPWAAQTEVVICCQMQSPLKRGEHPDTAPGDHPTGSRDAGLSGLQRDPWCGTLEELG